MAIRSRLKALAKQIIFGSSNTTTPTPHTPPVKSSPNFKQSPVTTEATMDPPKEPIETRPPVSESISQPEELTVESPVVEPPVVESPVEDTLVAPEQVTKDLSEASYVFDVVDLFPATCPHCDASSNNNWIRIENKFACGACEEPFAA